VLRKAYGGAYIALVSKDMGFDMAIAWPSAEIAVMGAEQAVSIIHRKEIKDSKNPEKAAKEKIEEYSNLFLNPYVSAKLGKIDMVIEPRETRKTLIKCLEMLMSKREKKTAKKHGNMPL